MEKLSNLSLAYDYLYEAKESKKFADIWQYICEKQEFTKEEIEKTISVFYTNLSLDGRFVLLGENVWDLRSRQSFDKVNIDINSVYADVEESLDPTEDEDEEEEEPKEYIDEEGAFTKLGKSKKDEDEDLF